MGTLIIFNVILMLIIALFLAAVKKWVKSERAKKTLLIVAPLLTIGFHYSSFIYLSVFDGAGIEYLSENPNLILPIYPCNVVMWCALIYGLMPKKDSKIALLFSDYIFWFGIASTLVGMFANMDFIANPTLSDYEVTKSIIAHATMLFNVMLIPVLGLLRPDFFRNMRNMIASVIAMYVIGQYCNLVLSALSSPEFAYYKNSMFIMHSPFDDVPFLKYPIIAVVGLFIYLIIFTVCDSVKNPRGSRWYNRAIAFFKRDN